ncbi:myelin protein zero-like 1 like isoform X2 [Chanos chanos]|uniref:Myelin protein zero-like 1 like isoform X2 n=1 Tax=Chanos chanos TaxID=29144 RepID=A0A6J2WW14_CHACN|nr:myelin protein zero-like protein 1 isoform X2 [Chanos chanos]
MELSNIVTNHVLLCGLALRLIVGLLPVTAIEVYAPDEVFVENGTTATLSCTFKSTQVVSRAASVAWSFVPEGSSESPVSIFYYTTGQPFYGETPQFKERVTWAGDLNKKDGSIKVSHMQFADNGTYFCDVKNPPDITGKPANTKIRVVLKESLPQTSTGVIAGGVICAIILIILITAVTYLIIRRQGTPHDYEGCTSLESVSTPATRPGKKAESSTEGSRCSSPSGPVQGPVIYAQLDHSGTKNPNSFHKMEPVVYADIRKN